MRSLLEGYGREVKAAAVEGRKADFTEAAQTWPFEHSFNNDGVDWDVNEGLMMDVLQANDEATSELTVNSYRNRLSDYLRVCSLCRIEKPYPMTPAIMIAYAAQVLNDKSRSVKPKSVRSYLSSCSKPHSDEYGTVPDATDLNKYLKGKLNNVLRSETLEDNFTADARLYSTFTADTLNRIVQLGLRDSFWLERAAAITLATLFFLRASQLSRITLKHLDFNQNAISTVIPPVKYRSLDKPKVRVWLTNQHSSNTFGNPRELIKRFVERRRRELGGSKEHTDNARLFGKLFTGNAAKKKSAQKLTDVLRMLAAKVGVQKAKIKELSSHACRRSGCAQALSTHADIARVQFHGCWKSAESMHPYTRLQALPSRAAFHFHGHLLPPSTTSLP